jgi:transcriptional regulator with PAS, ATPase and Fis domain
LIKKVFRDDEDLGMSGSVLRLPASQREVEREVPQTLEVEESLSLQDREKELIKKALDKHKNKRKYAARELGISERTLYRKIKEYNLK